jgi:hypothetical protein
MQFEGSFSGSKEEAIESNSEPAEIIPHSYIEVSQEIFNIILPSTLMSPKWYDLSSFSDQDFVPASGQVKIRLL